MTRKSTAMKKRKRLTMGTNSDSEGAVGDHPDTNAINRTLSNLYMSGKGLNTPQRDTSMKEEKEEVEADKEIEKALKKKARLKERYIYTPSTTFDDLGGLDQIINDLRLYLGPEQKDLTEIGHNGHKRILISGVAGVGKSKLAESIVNHLELPSLKCTFRHLFSGNPSEVESSCRNLFNYARSIQPCVLIIDRLDRIVCKRAETRTDNERDILTDTLIESFEELNKDNADITIIAITNTVDTLDYGFMTAARFIKKIHIDVPDEKTRASILRVLCKKRKLSDDVKFDELGSKTPGYVGADLRDLIYETDLISVRRLRDVTNNSNPESDGQEHSMDAEPNSSAIITQNDFIVALRKIKPSLKRDGFASIPNVTWADIGACDHIRDELLAKILLPIKFPTFIGKLNRGKTSRGLLLHGPPGCGKTSIAKALANEGDIAFISVKGPEVLNKYVGESEAKIREIFAKADKVKPCVIFFDEVDSICTQRSDSERSNVTQGVLSAILTEMDGFDNQSCFVLAATNRPDVLDSAILRPGRFDKHIFVGIPDAPARLDILKKLTRDGIPNFASEVSLESLAYDNRLRNFTGADLKGLIDRAKDIACIEMYRKMGTLDESTYEVKNAHIESALKERPASFSDEEINVYLKAAKKLGLD